MEADGASVMLRLHRGGFMQVKQNLQHKFPHLEVVGTNYPPGKTKVRAPCWSSLILPSLPPHERSYASLLLHSVPPQHHTEKGLKPLSA
jgi:hypothetical protein